MILGDVGAVGSLRLGASKLNIKLRTGKHDATTVDKFI